MEPIISKLIAAVSPEEAAQATPGLESTSFQSMIEQATTQLKTNPEKISGGESLTQTDFQEKRLALAEEIATAMRNGDEVKLAELHADYAKTNAQARVVAEQGLNASFARLSAPEIDPQLAKIPLGKFAKDLNPTTAKKVEKASPTAGKSISPKIAIPPRSSDPHTERPDEEVPQLKPEPLDKSHSMNLPNEKVTITGDAAIFPGEEPSFTYVSAPEGFAASAASPATVNVSGASASSSGASSISASSASSSLSRILAPSAGIHSSAAAPSTAVVSSAGGPVAVPSATVGMPMPSMPSFAATPPSQAGVPMSTSSSPTASAPSHAASPPPVASAPPPVAPPPPMASAPPPAAPPPPMASAPPPVAPPPPMASAPPPPAAPPPPMASAPPPPAALSSNSGGRTLPPTPTPQRPPPPSMPEVYAGRAAGSGNSGGSGGTSDNSANSAGAYLQLQMMDAYREQYQQSYPHSQEPVERGIRGDHSLLPPSPANGSFQTVAYQENTSNPFGVPEPIWVSVTKDERLGSVLQSMPKKAVDLYAATPPEEKLEMAQRLNEKTQVFLFTIDNKQAFISGTAMGRNTFDYLEGSLNKKIEEATEKGTASIDELMRQKSALSILRELSPDQREGYISLLEAETKPVAVN